MIPNTLKITRMTTITSRVWMILPLRGKPEKTVGPKYPSNHSMSRITIIQVSMKFLLFIAICPTTHHTVNTPQPHPSAGECFSPPLGGENQRHVMN
jgi:hypothetical protein